MGLSRMLDACRFYSGDQLGCKGNRGDRRIFQAGPSADMTDGVPGLRKIQTTPRRRDRLESNGQPFCGPRMRG